MERLYYRSTSISDLQAELRERELLAAARDRRAAPADRPGRSGLLGLLLRRRPHQQRSL